MNVYLQWCYNIARQKQERSVERLHLSHCRNSVTNCFPAQNFTEIGQLSAELVYQISSKSGVFIYLFIYLL